jgi:hypothetical protein
MFQKNLSSPSSGSKNETRKKPAQKQVALLFIILICNLFNDAAMANFRYHLSGGTEENHEKPVKKLVSQQRFKAGPS